MARVLHTRALVWASGMAVCQRLVLIHPTRRGDLGLLAHELTHVAQMQACGTALFWARYLLTRRWRLAYELAAYRVSLAYAPWELDGYAHILATKYWLGITVAHARAGLSA